MICHDDFPMAIRLFSEETKLLELLLLVNVLEVVLETVLLLLVTVVLLVPEDHRGSSRIIFVCQVLVGVNYQRSEMASKTGLKPWLF